ncbi:MAG: AI-2E family transporter [Myxococcota bacterium]
MTTASRNRGLTVLLGIACFIIVIAGLKSAADIILPFMVALFLSLLCVSPMNRLERHGLPSGLAIAVVMAAASVLVLLLLGVIGRSITAFRNQLPVYQQRLDDLVGDAIVWLNNLGLEADPQELIGSIDSAAIMRLVSDTASGFLGAMSNVFVVLLTMIFMLIESRTVSTKMRSALGDPDADLSGFTAAAEQVLKYMAIKTWVSLATGLTVGVLAAIVGLDFPLLWALIAFLFNFVPNIGSIIAAVPAVLLALIQLGPIHALSIGIGYVVINTFFGNAVEPRLMGNQLGLSTLIVFLSLLFWGWVWGPLGMLLSVPLTVVVKILLEHSDDLRWIAVLLGPGDPEPAAESSPEGAPKDRAS